MYQAAPPLTTPPAGPLADVELCATPVGRGAVLSRPPALTTGQSPTPRLAGLVVAGIAHLVLAAIVLTAWSTREAVKPLVLVTTIIEPPPEKPELLPAPPVPTMVKLPAPAELAMPRIDLAEPPPAAPAAAAITAPAAATPVAVQGGGLPNFAGSLMAHLARYKRYPAEARERRHEGVVTLRFRMDRAGRVLAARLEKGSGFVLLDEEAIALLQRAAPLPRIPDALTGDVLELVIPIQFSLRQSGRRGD